jgi:hypothetical protein
MAESMSILAFYWKLQGMPACRHVVSPGDRAAGDRAAGDRSYDEEFSLPENRAVSGSLPSSPIGPFSTGLVISRSLVYNNGKGLCIMHFYHYYYYWSLPYHV